MDELILPQNPCAKDKIAGNRIGKQDTNGKRLNIETEKTH